MDSNYHAATDGAEQLHEVTTALLASFNNFQSPRDGLLRIGSEVRLLMHEMKVLHQQSTPSPTDEDLVLLIRTAENLDVRLRNWFTSLPLDYFFTSVSVLTPITPPSVDEAWIWPGAVHLYGDLFMANLLNNYRILRIYLSTLVMQAARMLMCSHHDQSKLFSLANDLDTTMTATQYKLSDLVDDICASVPYHLGIPPAAGPDYFGTRTKMSTAALGACFLIRPLYVASQLDCISSLQRRWIRGRLKAIARFGFGQAMILSQQDTA